MRALGADQGRRYTHEVAVVYTSFAEQYLGRFSWGCRGHAPESRTLSRDFSRRVEEERVTPGRG